MFNIEPEEIHPWEIAAIVGAIAAVCAVAGYALHNLWHAVA